MTTTAQYGRCPVCGDLFFPVHALTPCGHDAQPELHPFTEAGEVYSWTRSHGRGGAVLIAMTDFLGGALRVSAPVPGVDEVAIGDRLVVRAEDGGGFTLAPVS